MKIAKHLFKRTLMFLQNVKKRIYHNKVTFALFFNIFKANEND